MKLDISEYEFNVGDEVITIDGMRGTITEICDCEYCRERGFFEPVWTDETGEDEWITDIQAERGFPNFYKIGEHRFNPFAKHALELSIHHAEGVLEQMKKQLKRIEELEGEGT